MSPTSYQTAPPRVICNFILNYREPHVNIKPQVVSRKSRERREIKKLPISLASFIFQLPGSCQSYQSILGQEFPELENLKKP